MDTLVRMNESFYFSYNSQHAGNTYLKKAVLRDHTQSNEGEFLSPAFAKQEVYRKDQKRHHNQQGRERLSKLYEGVFPMLFFVSCL